MRRAAVRGVVDAPLALALGFVPVVLIDIGVTLARYGIDRAAPGVRVVHLAYLVGYRAFLALVLALLAVMLVQVIAGLPGRPRLARRVAAGALGVVSIAVGSVVFADDLYSYLPLQRVLLMLALSLVPAGVVVMRLLVELVLERRVASGSLRPRWRRWFEQALLRFPFVVIGFGAALANHIAIPFGNPGPHLGLLVVEVLGRLVQHEDPVVGEQQSGQAQPLTLTS